MIAKIQKPLSESGAFLVYNEASTIFFTAPPTAELHALFGPGVFKVYAEVEVLWTGNAPTGVTVFQVVDDQPW